jgi:hypothetical protein
MRNRVAKRQKRGGGFWIRCYNRSKSNCPGVGVVGRGRDHGEGSRWQAAAVFVCLGIGGEEGGESKLLSGVRGVGRGGRSLYCYSPHSFEINFFCREFGCGRDCVSRHVLRTRYTAGVGVRGQNTRYM